MGAFATTPEGATVTCATASSKFLLLGLSTGAIALYDVFGNLLDHHPALHDGPVTAVALGAAPPSDEIIASSGGERRTLRAARLFTGASHTPAEPGSQSAMLTRAAVLLTTLCAHHVVAVAVDPNFGRPKFGSRVAYVDRVGRVAIFTAGWFAGSDFVVADGNGLPVFDLAWVGHLLAYSYSSVVKVYDTRAHRPVCIVAAPGSSSPPSPMPSPANTSVDAQSDQGEEQRSGTSRGGDGADVDSGDVGKGDVASPAERTESEEAEEESPLQEDIQQPRRPDRWALRTKIYMESDIILSTSPHKESPISLYITWPSGARIVKIGPHRDILPSEPISPRDIQVSFKVEREGLFAAEASESNYTSDQDLISSIIGTTEEAPLLSLVPFGAADSVALVGTPTRGLEIHLVSCETGSSLKTMAMPHKALHDADLLTVPGGDPLVLIIGKWTPTTDSDHATSENYSPVEDPRSLTFVRPLTTAERVKWLLGQERFSDALTIAQSAPGGSLRRAEVSLEDVGEQFLESLRESGNYAKLKAVLPETIATTTPYVGFRARDKVMEKRKRRWQRWIEAFRKSNNLAILASAVPTYEPCLGEESYNAILVELAASNSIVMLDVLKTWPADVFDVSTVTKAIEGRLSDSSTGSKLTREEREPLREGLLMLYGLSGRHDETLNLLLREQSPKVYDYIRSHHLYEAVRSPATITGLFKIDSSAATKILSHAPETVLPPEALVPIFSKVDNPKWTFMYLHAIFRMDVDQAPKYHNQLLKLYVDHGSSGMLYNFLRTSTHYSLDRALREMGGPTGFKRGHLANERVYVLSAMGDLNSAMTILLDELGDTFAAIEFASDHGDVVLWERLIEHAKTHADTLAALLDSPAGGKVDPVRLIPLLNSSMRIPNLRDRLHRILIDAALERALREDTAAALHDDASKLLQTLDDSVSFLQ